MLFTRLGSLGEKLALSAGGLRISLNTAEDPELTRVVYNLMYYQVTGQNEVPVTFDYSRFAKGPLDVFQAIAAASDELVGFSVAHRSGAGNVSVHVVVVRTDDVRRCLLDRMATHYGGALLVVQSADRAQVFGPTLRPEQADFAEARMLKSGPSPLIGWTRSKSGALRWTNFGPVDEFLANRPILAVGEPGAKVDILLSHMVASPGLLSAKDQAAIMVIGGFNVAQQAVVAALVRPDDDDGYTSSIHAVNVNLALVCDEMDALRQLIVVSQADRVFIPDAKTVSRAKWLRDAAAVFGWRKHRPQIVNAFDFDMWLVQ